jgi:hypothetical protein
MADIVHGKGRLPIGFAKVLDLAVVSDEKRAELRADADTQ